MKNSIEKKIRKNARKGNGYFFDIADQRNLSFNNDDGEGAEDPVNFVYTVIKNIWKGKKKIGNEERAILKKLIESFYDHVNEKKLSPDFKKIYKYMDIFQKQLPAIEKTYLDFHSLKLSLRPFIDGVHKEILNSKEIIINKKDSRKVIILDKAILKGDISSFFREAGKIKTEE